MSNEQQEVDDASKALASLVGTLISAGVSENAICHAMLIGGLGIAVRNLGMNNGFAFANSVIRRTFDIVSN